MEEIKENPKGEKFKMGLPATFSLFGSGNVLCFSSVLGLIFIFTHRHTL